jgi:phosphate transport system permease protein
MERADLRMMNKAYRFIKGRDAVMRGIFLFCAVFAILALACICVFLFASGVPFIGRIGFGNFFGTTWHIDSASYGILSMIVTSLYLTALSTIIGVTIGLFTAICLFKFCPKKAIPPIRQMINLLAGIPSVIYGLFGLIVIVPFLRDNISPNGIGFGILAASLVVSIMILPTIVSVSLDALNAVPKAYHEGALALGATSEQSVFKVIVPAAKSGIFAAVVLAIGRAIGETMAVIMVIGNSPVMPRSLFQSARTMTANIALGAKELGGDAASALVATGVVLFAFTLLLNISFSLLRGGEKRDKKRAQKTNS